jgi:hypothetical protein
MLIVSWLILGNLNESLTLFVINSEIGKGGQMVPMVESSCGSWEGY